MKQYLAKLTVGGFYTETKLISRTKVSFIHYQTLSKEDTTWKIDVSKFSNK